MTLPPVLYLDLDDTVISWQGGSPHAAPGAHEFVVWAMEHFEVRWLTTWCPDGEMGDKLLHDLARMLRLAPETLRGVRGFDWADTGSKLNGVAWLEHLVLHRPFLWVEDNYGFGGREQRMLDELGLASAYRRVNVTEEPGALQELHGALLREFSPLAA